MNNTKIVKLITLGFLTITLFVFAVSGILNQKEEVELPILMYHHIDKTGDNIVTISDSLFEEHMKYITEAGYNPISFDEAIAFVDERGLLPDNPICIVFDDGYESNYTYAFPVLQKYKIKATICIIGIEVGKSTYKDTEFPIIPHFSWDEMRIMIDSGLVSIQNHTYDMHMYAPCETGVVRENVLRFEGESYEEYSALLTNDYNLNASMIKENLGYDPMVFAYPNGKYDDISETIIISLGARVTLSTNIGMNILRQGDRNSLCLMKRYSINQQTDIETLQSYIDGVVLK